MAQNAFEKGYRRFKDGVAQFKLFKANALPQIERVVARLPRFGPLEEGYGGHSVEDFAQDALQVRYGERLMGRETVDGKTAIETGPTLLYSLGPSGDVAVSLYPAKSAVARPFEDHIYLRIGRLKADQLHKRLKRDLADLVAYGHVTSLDGTPTSRERLRVWWLRRTHPMQIGAKFAKASSVQQVGGAIEFTSRTMATALLGALLKPIGILVVVALLIRYGMPQLASIIAPACGHGG
jgi:hypothetical protein